jgi:NAD-dependent deacetylase
MRASLAQGEATMSAPSDVAKLSQILSESKRAVVFTGAGISTESGIPDFRSPGGIWTKMMPVYYDEYVGSAEIRRDSWKKRFDMEKTWTTVKPNAGHNAVAALVGRGLVTHVITQNIDNLHQDSGVPAEQVIELHGNTRYAKCLDCGRRMEIADIKTYFERTGEPPDCPRCGGIVKTATISFGQAMPEGEMRRAERATLACDLFLVLGSSLVVYPAAGFPLLAKKNRAKLVIVNRDPTEQDVYADLVINSEIGPTMTAAVGSLTNWRPN